MVDDAKLESAVAQLAALERAVKHHLDVVTDVAEQRRGLVVYRHAHALRGALEQWSETRKETAGLTS